LNLGFTGQAILPMDYFCFKMLQCLWWFQISWTKDCKHMFGSCCSLDLFCSECD